MRKYFNMTDKEYEDNGSKFTEVKHNEMSDRVCGSVDRVMFAKILAILSKKLDLDVDKMFDEIEEELKWNYREWGQLPETTLEADFLEYYLKGTIEEAKKCVEEEISK